MSEEYRNIYKIARRTAGFTQEAATERLGISVESVRAYEIGQRIPPNDIVNAMKGQITMGMTVDNVSYLTGMRQDARVSTAGKQDQKEAAADVGKTQQSTVSASLDQVNMGQDGIAVTEVSRQQGAEQSAAQKQPPAPRMDTVEISEEGRAASVQMRSQQSETETAAAEVEQYEAEDLSEYTDSELKQMYYKGEITRQEYEDETGTALD